MSGNFSRKYRELKKQNLILKICRFCRLGIDKIRKKWRKCRFRLQNRRFLKILQKSAFIETESSFPVNFSRFCRLGIEKIRCGRPNRSSQLSKLGKMLRNASIFLQSSKKKLILVAIGRSNGSHPLSKLRKMLRNNSIYLQK